MNQTVQSGKLVVAVMVLVAMALGGYAWWHNYRSNPRSRAFWGPQAIRLIESASRVEFFRLNGEAESGSSVVDLSDTSGQLIHARHALVIDSSFRWDSPLPGEQPEWDFALRFSDGSQQLTVHFDLDQQRLEWSETGSQLLLVPAINEAFRKKYVEWSEGGERDVGRALLPVDEVLGDR